MFINSININVINQNAANIKNSFIDLTCISIYNLLQYTIQCQRRYDLRGPAVQFITLSDMVRSDRSTILSTTIPLLPLPWVTVTPSKHLRQRRKGQAGREDKSRQTNTGSRRSVTFRPTVISTTLLFLELYFDYKKITTVVCILCWLQLQLLLLYYILVLPFNKTQTTHKT